MSRAKQAFDRQLQSLQALRGTGDTPASREQLASALKSRSNYLVARAAEVVADLRVDALIPDLLAAYERFFVDPVGSDPQCLGKTAIVRALRELGHRGAPPFQRGIDHIQLEPAWGGRADTAAELRAACALALADCILDELIILTHLADALADSDKLVRLNAALAIEQLGREEGALLLRLKVLVGDVEPDVFGQCLTSLLNLAPQHSVSFVSRFLHSPSADVQLEAASALAQARDPEAIVVLKDYWTWCRLPTDLRQALLMSLAASPQREAADFLLSLLAVEPLPISTTALVALATSRFRSEVAARVQAELESRQSQQLDALFAEHFGSSPE